MAHELTPMTTGQLDDLYEASKLDDTGRNIRQLITEIRFHRQNDRVDTAIARQLGECMRKSSMLSTLVLRLRRALTMVHGAMEMVRDANRDEPHIPPVALDTIEQAIKIAADELDDPSAGQSPRQ
jgi:hypothetical protein